ncbi:hypothetical protein ACOTTU_07705 [Roseobacter sp. EG26]|uniref:hypothetical protein n=1 Tax=Roseobacter sp. EG26 TaxID=3412477 RepID=UPI003CE5341D
MTKGRSVSLMENVPPIRLLSEEPGSDDAEKAQIVRAFFDLADAIIEDAPKENPAPLELSLSRSRIDELIDKHSDAQSVEHIKNIWNALQYLVDESAAEKSTDPTASESSVTKKRT